MSWEIASRSEAMICGYKAQASIMPKMAIRTPAVTARKRRYSSTSARRFVMSSRLAKRDNELDDDGSLREYRLRGPQCGECA